MKRESNNFYTKILPYVAISFFLYSCSDNRAFQTLNVGQSIMFVGTMHYKEQFGIIGLKPIDTIYQDTVFVTKIAPDTVDYSWRQLFFILPNFKASVVRLKSYSRRTVNYKDASDGLLHETTIKNEENSVALYDLNKLTDIEDERSQEYRFTGKLLKH